MGSLQILDIMHVVAGYLFETNQGKQDCKSIGHDIMDEIKRSGYWPLTTMQRLEKMLLFLHSLNLPIGKHFPCADIPAPAAYAIDTKEIRGILKAMAQLGWLTGTEDNTYFSLTIAGLTHAEELLRTNIDSTQVFVAMQFDEPLLDEAFEQAIHPACSEAGGFTARRTLEMEYNDGIMDQVIAEIKRSKFVIADLTYGNLGAYYEAGFAKGLGREVILCCNQQWYDEEIENQRNPLHFDVQSLNVILWDNPEELKQRLINRINANK